MLLIVGKKAATPIFPHLLPQGQQMATLALDQGDGVSPIRPVEAELEGPILL